MAESWDQGKKGITAVDTAKFSLNNLPVTPHFWGAFKQISCLSPSTGICVSGIAVVIQSNALPTAGALGSERSTHTLYYLNISLAF